MTALGSYILGYFFTIQADKVLNRFLFSSGCHSVPIGRSVFQILNYLYLTETGACIQVSAQYIALLMDSQFVPLFSFHYETIKLG